MTGCYGVRVSRRLRRPTWRDWHRLRDPGQPDRRVGEEDRRTDEERNAEGARPPATILVVDDDPSVRGMLARLLHAENYNVVEAADGLDALNQCARHAVAAVVTDVRMPRMGGFELGRRIAAEWPRVQLLFVTAYPDVDAGEVASRVLTKPFRPQEFVAIVRSLADRYWDATGGGARGDG
jgi:two-component system, OmpR family, response regulator